MAHEAVHTIPAYPELTRDLALLGRIALGDKPAFKELYDAYFDRLYRLAFQFLRQEEWALDVVQDVFLQLWVRREKLGQVENPRGWLSRVMRNRLIGAMELQAVRKRYEAGAPLPDHYLLADTPTQVKELEKLVAEAVASLPASQQQLYRMTREQGMNHEQIAGELGISRKTVANNLSLVLKHIRRHLHEQGAYLPAWVIVLLLH